MQQAGRHKKRRNGVMVLAAVAATVAAALALAQEPAQRRSDAPPVPPVMTQTPEIAVPAHPLPGLPVPPTQPAPGEAPEAASAARANPASAAAPASTASEAQPVPQEEAPPEPAPNVAQAEGLSASGAFAMRQVFANEVKRRLAVPQADQQSYGRLLQTALDHAEHGDLANEYVVLVDRSQNVQALFLYFRAKAGDNWSMIGATPVSTGRPGTYDHFITPLGVFWHSPENMDFRAEGTLNEFGIRGYGARDMRIYDFGWADGERGWGKGGISQMRLQMHATDPEKLEPLLGIRHSKGCVRIPAALNVFLDHHGILDADYDARAAEGGSLWILKAKRDATPWAGRYLVIVDTARKTRPAWAPAPGAQVRAKLPLGADSAD
jgi:hypothetical protein